MVEAIAEVLLKCWNELAPDALWEIEVDCVQFCQVSGLNRGLEGVANKHVLFDELVSICVSTKFEEERLEEATTELIDSPEL